MDIALESTPARGPSRLGSAFKGTARAAVAAVAPVAAVALTLVGGVSSSDISCCRMNVLGW